MDSISEGICQNEECENSIIFSVDLESPQTARSIVWDCDQCGQKENIAFAGEMLIVKDIAEKISNILDKKLKRKKISRRVDYKIIMNLRPSNDQYEIDNGFDFDDIVAYM